MKNRITISILVLLYSFMTSCAQKKDYVVTIKTKYGDMIAILYEETPKHKANFIKLAQEHYFDSLLFHRVIQGFMIQGGDPDSKKAKAGQSLGNGGPDYTLESEFNSNFFHQKGALSAARLPDNLNPKKASSGSQFYIVQGQIIPETDLTIDPAKFNQAMQKFFQNPANKPSYDSLNAFYQARDQKGYEAKIRELKPRAEKETGIKTNKEVSADKLKAYTTVGGTPQLDGEYTVFGKVIKGLDVIDKIAALPKDQYDRPTEDVRMIVTVEELSKKKIEKLYGYIYPENKK